jgi:hypothetical protein
LLRNITQGLGLAWILWNDIGKQKWTRGSKEGKKRKMTEKKMKENERK